MKQKFLISMVLLLVGLYMPASYSGTKALVAPIPTVTITLANDVMVDSAHYEFDVYVLQTGTTPWEFSGMQTGLTYNSGIKNGTLSCAWVSGSQDPIFAAAGVAFAAPNVATAGVIKVAAKLPSGGWGTGPVISSTGPLGTKFGRLRITCLAGFFNAAANIQMWQTETTGYPTQPGAYVADDGGQETNVDLLASGTVTYTNNLSNPILPVELSSFTSNVNGRQVNLNWETKTEVNSNKYEIQRSIVSAKDVTVTWATIGYVQAAGTSNSTKKYSYTEKDLQSGKYQYRLKMIDNDGSYKYSIIVETEIALPKNFELSQNYPNPFNPSTRIDYSLPFDSRVTLDVYNITGERIGQIVNEEQTAGYYTVNMSSSSLNKSLASGVYIYKMNAVDKSTGNTFTSIKKMMLLK
jgi:hypothetical protein